MNPFPERGMDHRGRQDQKTHKAVVVSQKQVSTNRENPEDR